MLSNLFGYHLLQLSINPSAALYDGARILHCINAASSAKPAGGVALHCEYDQLPLEDERGCDGSAPRIRVFSQPHQVLKGLPRYHPARAHYYHRF